MSMFCLSCREDSSGRAPRWKEALEIPPSCIAHYARRTGSAVLTYGGAACRQIEAGANRVASFIKENWYTLLSYAIAWGVILACVGMMHGFDSTASPFSIGMGVGIGIGCLVGVVCVKVFESENSIGGRISERMEAHLDYTTKQIVITVAIAVYLIAAARFPHGVGAFSGIIVGDHLATLFLLGHQIVRQVLSVEERIAKIEKGKKRMEKRLEHLEEEAARRRAHDERKFEKLLQQAQRESAAEPLSANHADGRRSAPLPSEMAERGESGDGLSKPPLFTQRA